MTTDEKVFLTGLIKGFEKRMDGFEGRVNMQFEKIDQRFDGLEGKVEQNSTDIRLNGMQIEFMRNDLAQIKEGDSFSHELNVKVEALMENMGIDIPALQQAVSNHSKRIKVLESKRA